jgi:hypothetical protein
MGDGRAGVSGRETGAERDLARLLATLAPALDPRPYVFVACGERPLDPGLVDAAIGLVREREGVTLILPEEVARAWGLACESTWARIELTVHSDLEAVGLMAAVSSALAGESIPCNPLAGFHHDHVLVPWARAEDARTALERLAPRP